MRWFSKHILLSGLIFVLIIGGCTLIWAANLTIPDFEAFDERKVVQSTKIYDRTGEILLFDVHQDIRRTVINFDEIATSTKLATMAIEDAEFYNHRGVRPLAILRSLWTNILTGSSAGGSTITQQVVKNAILTGEKKLSRKLKEAFIAIRLEQVMEKDDILNLYLNEIPYGGSIYGVQEAAQSFFAKDAIDLTLAESAYIAALPQAPTYYSPYGQHKDDLDNRKDIVLGRMRELGYITDAELKEALSETVEFKKQASQSIKAPHFVMYVRQYLVEKYGEDVVNSGGLKVITTLDYDLQEQAEEIALKYALENKDKFNAENASMMGLNPQTGEILVMVGSRNYFDDEIDGNYNIGLAKRQPGSTFKPFVYATAFKKGYTPDTVVFDVETQFSTACDTEGTPLPGFKDTDCYIPVNYDDIYRGPMTLRDALAQSINIPAIKTLYLAGLTSSLRTAQDLGITTLTDVNQYGLTLVLGGGETSLLEMTGAYGVFAADGIKNPAASILKVEDRNGAVLESYRSQPKEVLDPAVAATINDVLSDNVARAPSYGNNSALYFPGRQVAAKTGTTNDYRDAWIIGYTPTFVLGAWAGNNDNRPMEKKVAGLIVSPMWHEFMAYAIQKTPSQNFTAAPVPPENLKPVLSGQWRGGQSYTIDSISGKLATEFTPDELRREIVVTNPHSILHWVDKNNPRGTIPTKPQNDSQYELWEIPVQKWVAEQGIATSTVVIPTEFDDIHKPEFRPQFDIVSPTNNQLLQNGTRYNISIAATSSQYPIAEADYYLGATYLGNAKGSNPVFSFKPSDFGITNGNVTLRVVLYDSVRNQNEQQISLTVTQ